MDSVSVVELISIEGELVTDAKPVPNISVAFTRPWVKSEVTGEGEEGLLPGNVGDSGEGLAFCDSWGGKELDMTERLIWSYLIRTKGKYCFISSKTQLA